MEQDDASTTNNEDDINDYHEGYDRIEQNELEDLYEDTEDQQYMNKTVRNDEASEAEDHCKEEEEETKTNDEELQSITNNETTDDIDDDDDSQAVQKVTRKQQQQQVDYTRDQSEKPDPWKD